MKNISKWAMTLVMMSSAAAFAGVSVSSPSSGATVSSPAHFVASASPTNQYPITALQIYVDNQLKYDVKSSHLDTYLSLGGGFHTAVIKSWNSANQTVMQSVPFNVSGSAPAPSGTGVNVSSPTNGGTSGSPIHVTASAQAPARITAIHIYLDNKDMFQTGASSVDTHISAGTGNHNLVVQAWDRNGTVYKKAVAVDVTGGSSTPTSSTTSSGSAFHNIDQMSNWFSCSSCAGAGGSGPTAPFSMTEYRSSPSIDGASTQFWLGHGGSYAAAYWYKELPYESQATHFTYDLYFYYQNASAPQALEFDANQAVNSRFFIFGTECDIRGSGNWDVYDTSNHRWVNTGVGCRPGTYTWNHLTEEFQRHSDGSYTYVAITLNGVKHYINRTYWSKSHSGNELTVAVQLDGNQNCTSYSLWADKITLNYW